VTQSAFTSAVSPAVEAVRLLGGSEDEVLQGIALIDSAASRGDPDALERKALLEAVGCARPQNWSDALDFLQAAAELGSTSAQGQLLVLARASSETPPNWAAMRSKISVENLTRVPEKRPLCESPRLRVMEGFASNAECEWLAERARSRLRPARVFNLHGSQTIEAARTNSAIEFQLSDMDLVVEAVRARISAATRLPLPLFEPSQVLHYRPGQEFKPHHDYFDPQSQAHAEELKCGQRIATFLIYLNDDYIGGETAFPRAGIRFRGRAGDALFLANVERTGRPDPASLHSGTPPTSGDKWIFLQWIRDRAPPAPPGPQG
jgi:prolyl 4-hydroxylase